MTWLPLQNALMLTAPHYLLVISGIYVVHHWMSVSNGVAVLKSVWRWRLAAWRQHHTGLCFVQTILSIELCSGNLVFCCCVLCLVFVFAWQHLLALAAQMVQFSFGIYTRTDINNNWPSITRRWSIMKRPPSLLLPVNPWCRPRERKNTHKNQNCTETTLRFFLRWSSNVFKYCLGAGFVRHINRNGVWRWLVHAPVKWMGRQLTTIW